MPRYKLRLPARGDHLNDECGHPAFVADSAEEARRYFVEWYGEDDEMLPEWIHPEIGRGRIVYKRDIDAGDAHEDAEPGDSYFEYVQDTGRELGAGEVRLWDRGPAQPLWKSEGLWHEGRHGWRTTVAGEVIGEFDTQAGEREAREAAIERWVEAWKEAHPECGPTFAELDDTQAGGKQKP